MNKVFAVLFLVFFSGCMLGPDYERPVMEMPEGFQQDYTPSNDDIANLPWWEVFQDETLQTYILAALRGNKDLGIAYERINEARALLGVVKADLFPSIGISGALQKQEFGDSRKEAFDNEGYTLAGAASWELDLWGKIRRSTESAQAQLFATEEAYRAITIALIAQVATTYFQLRDLDNQLDISKRTLVTRKDATEIIGARFKQGYVAELDLNQAQVQEADAAAAVQLFERDVVKAENALNVLLGENPKTLDRGARLMDHTLPPNIPAGLPIQLIERRPDVLSAEQLLAAQTARVGVEQAQRLPAISLTGALGVESLDLSDFNLTRDRYWSVGGDLVGPLLSADRNVSKVEAEKARTAQAALSYENTVLNALREVEDSLVSVRTLRKETEIRREQVRASKNAARLSRARYDAGETSYLEVLDTERSLFRVELAESDTIQFYLSSIVSLYKALGGGWNMQPEPEPTPNYPAP